MSGNDTKPLTEAEIQEWELRFRKHTDPIDACTSEELTKAGKERERVYDDALDMFRRALVEIAELRERAEKAEHSARQFCGAHVGLSFTHCPACEAETQTARAELPATPSEPMTPVADHTAALGGLANESSLEALGRTAVPAWMWRVDQERAESVPEHGGAITNDRPS